MCCPCLTGVWDKLLIHEVGNPLEDERFISLRSIVLAQSERAPLVTYVNHHDQNSAICLTGIGSSILDQIWLHWGYESGSSRGISSHTSRASEVESCARSGSCR